MRPALLLICGVAVSLLLAAFALTGWFSSGFRTATYDGTPRDQELIASFRAHRAAFEIARTLALADGPALNNGTLNPIRRREYDRLLAPVAPGMIVLVDTAGGRNVIKFIFRESGAVIGPEWSKGLAYIPGDPTREGTVQPDLDDLLQVPDGDYLRPIEPHWFVVYGQQLQ